MINIMLRTAVLYLTLIVTMRFMGKRQIGEVQVSEFIVTIMLSEIAATPILDPDIPLLYAIVAIVILLSIELLVSFLLIKSSRLKRIICGSPSVLIKHGQLDMRELRKNRVDIEELFSELRQKGCASIAEVDYAILEENGQLSVFLYAKASPPTAEAMSLSPTEKGVAHLCIADGRVCDDGLSLVGWTRQRLEREIAARHITLHDIFIMTVDDTGDVYVIKRKKDRE